MALDPVIILAGPTASGKSDLGLELAKCCGGVIINADSLQVYRELRILTARPDARSESQVPHRLYGTVSASERFRLGSGLLWRVEKLIWFMRPVRFRYSSVAVGCIFVLWWRGSHGSQKFRLPIDWQPPNYMVKSVSHSLERALPSETPRWRRAFKAAINNV